MLLPDVPREGIVVNLAELRLYYFPPGVNQVQVYPWALVSRAGNAGDDHPRRAENPEPDLDADGGHPRAFAGERD
jgi:hypothetical protein